MTSRMKRFPGGSLAPSHRMIPADLMLTFGILMLMVSKGAFGVNGSDFRHTCGSRIEYRLCTRE